MERRAIKVIGTVQGVGFRPFVFNLAERLRLVGHVKNCAGSVVIEVEGDRAALDNFQSELINRSPPLAHIDQVRCEARPIREDSHFRIADSDEDATGAVFIAPDVAVCADCLTEMFDPNDRRFRYPFLNCTTCGPRLTIVTGAPYDRQRTSMAGFAKCAACRAEYEDPTNRRFHAQPTCCAVCGPRLQVLDDTGSPIETTDPLTHFAEAIQQGRIGALKGLGGYHLACDARSTASVGELRRRKHRDEKPFAIMAADLAMAEALCELQPAERGLLQGRAGPIVLLRKRPGAGVAEECAPGNPCLGVMLPYTPLHHLLMQALIGIPLVMTSGNRSDEPIAYDDQDAVDRLAGIADLYLTHNRPIHVRCDDSVTGSIDGEELPLRRSRGYAPQPIRLPVACPVPMLAVGGQLKGTFALGRSQHAFMSHHLGDLDHFDAYRAFVRDIDLFQRLFSIRPKLLVHDLHPNYSSTEFALAEYRPRREDARPATLGVQHHHAHMASCMAEHGLSGPVIGVAFDGTGYGTDGAIWGGEFLVGDFREFRRAAHLRYVGMPGGDKAIREPWRMALAHLEDGQIDAQFLHRRIAPLAIRTVEKMLERGFNTPLTSSVGRLFDAVASLAGLRDEVSFEGQAAMELEWAAMATNADGAYPFEIVSKPGESTLVIDTRPLIGAVAADAGKGVEAGRIARRFHSTMVDMIVTVCGGIRQQTGLNDVALSGGVFMNVLLLREAKEALRRDGFAVFSHRLVPPNDAGLSLGQLAIAACCATENARIN